MSPDAAGSTDEVQLVPIQVVAVGDAEARLDRLRIERPRAEAECLFRRQGIHLCRPPVPQARSAATVQRARQARSVRTGTVSAAIQSR